MPAPNTSIPAELVDGLASAQHVVVLTGAGISAESGVPTFRDAQTGLWAKFRPEDLATPEAFRENPRRVWEWYAWRREKVAAVKPNPAHVALAELEALVPRFTLVTQNVDGLHQRAGSREVIELHGNLTRTKCFDEDRVVSDWPATDERPPRCPTCGGFLRPDVVWFGETLPEQALAQALQASAACDVFLAVGTSGLVYPAAGLPYTALENGATVVEINPNPSPLARSADHLLQASAGAALPELLRWLKKALGNRRA